MKVNIVKKTTVLYTMSVADLQRLLTSKAHLDIHIRPDFDLEFIQMEELFGGGRTVKAKFSKTETDA